MSRLSRIIDKIIALVSAVKNLYLKIFGRGLLTIRGNIIFSCIIFLFLVFFITNIFAESLRIVFFYLFVILFMSAGLGKLLNRTR